MKCVYCQKEIENYIIVSLEILTAAAPQLESFGALKYSAALIECPHCEMIFFMKPDSQRLVNMNLLNREDLVSSMWEGVNDISRMTPSEKRAYLDRITKEHVDMYKQFIGE